MKHPFTSSVLCSVCLRLNVFGTVLLCCQTLYGRREKGSVYTHIPFLFSGTSSKAHYLDIYWWIKEKGYSCLWMTLTLIESAALFSSAIFLSEFSTLSAMSCLLCSSCLCWNTNPGAFHNLNDIKSAGDKRLQRGAELNYLHLTLFYCNCHSVVAFVLIHHTQQANELLISAAVNLQKSVMTVADAFFDPRRGLNQIVFL